MHVQNIRLLKRRVLRKTKHASSYPSTITLLLRAQQITYHAATQSTAKKNQTSAMRVVLTLNNYRDTNKKQKTKKRKSRENT